MVHAIDCQDGGRVGVPAAVVQRDCRALRARIKVPPVDPAAIKREPNERRVRRRAAVVGGAVKADVLRMEAIKVEVGEAAATAAVLAAGIQVALLHIAVAHVIILRVDLLPVERHPGGPPVREPHLIERRRGDGPRGVGETVQQNPAAAVPPRARAGAEDVGVGVVQ